MFIASRNDDDIHIPAIEQPPVVRNRVNSLASIMTKLDCVGQMRLVNIADNRRIPKMPLQ